MGAGSSRVVSDPNELLNRQYDYVIVGGGAAGCVLANRLSQDPTIRVLLVEAGHDHKLELMSRIPAAWAKLLQTSADWNYSTTSQSQLHGRSLYWPRGKILGGSTSINACMYQHSTPQDLDQWATLGATGWSYKEMQKYYRKAEKYNVNSSHPQITHLNRGDEGLWKTGYIQPHSNTQHFIEACKHVGIPSNPDFSTPDGALGVAPFPTFIDSKGQRSSAATAYLDDTTLARENLTVLVSTRTTHLLFSDPPEDHTESAKCIGIEVAQTRDGARLPIQLAEGGEVILCAGAVNTPQVLLCSGIGPEKTLAEAGIPKVVVSEHVGRNMKDHLVACIAFRARTSRDYLGDSIKSLPALAQWFLFGSGPMTTNIGEAAAFIRLDHTEHLWKSPVSKLSQTAAFDTSTASGSPDYELIGVPALFFDHGFSKPSKGELSYTMACTQLQPMSAGHIAVRSESVWEPPIIEPNYFSDRRDVDNMIRATRVCLGIAHAEPFAKHLILKDHTANASQNVQVNASPVPTKTDPHWLSDQNPETLTDEVIEEWLRGNVETLYHPVSTARIGSSIETGVVDVSLKVHGVQSLRVVDASVFPNQISAHTTATVIAVAEKASEMILEERTARSKA